MLKDANLVLMLNKVGKNPMIVNKIDGTLILDGLAQEETRTGNSNPGLVSVCQDFWNFY